ncbi:MAG: hypothetical protein JXB49_15275 [Bacteroidales bacterium]|nr:hypothetical protein [Bacteroidales bacterium]
MLKLAFDDILRTMVKYPLTEVKVFQNGPWRVSGYKDLFDMNSLECNTLNKLVGTQLNILIDRGENYLKNILISNLLVHEKPFVCPNIHINLPVMIPLDIWLDNSYFLVPVQQPQSNIPLHSHPNTNYLKIHFNELLKRYETYYIAEACGRTKTMMIFHKGTDLEKGERKRCESWAKQQPITDWIRCIKIWPLNSGDLYLIPLNSIHGHGGNQIVLGMDTNASLGGTEHSFFTWAFMCSSCDYLIKTLKGKSVKMYLDHRFNNERWREKDWLKELYYLRQEEVIKWTMFEPAYIHNGNNKRRS